MGEIIDRRPTRPFRENESWLAVEYAVEYSPMLTSWLDLKLPLFINIILRIWNKW